MQKRSVKQKKHDYSNLISCLSSSFLQQNNLSNRNQNYAIGFTRQFKSIFSLFYLSDYQQENKTVMKMNVAW